MALKKLGVYNDFSDELKKLIALPKKGTQISYRFLDTYYDPMSGNTFFKAHLKIPPFSKCFDPGKNEWVEIGLLSGVDQFGNPIPNRIRRVWVSPQESAGMLHLTIGNSQDDELYQYLELASFNAANKNRDEEIHPILERVNFEAEAKENRQALRMKRDALIKAAALSKEEVYNMTLLLGYDTELSEEEMRFNIEDYAETEPEDFMERISDKQIGIKSLVAQAIALDVAYISVEESKLKWTDSDGDIMKLADLEEDMVYEQFVEFIEKKKQVAILDQMNKLVDLKLAKKKAKK
jgi:hypothetical protein